MTPDILQVDAKFELDRAYFSESYTEWRAGISRYRKHQLKLAVAAWSAGLIVMLATDLLVLGAGLMLLGVFEGIDDVWSRRRWIAARLETRSADAHQTVEMHFSAAGIEHAGPTAHGHIEWRGIKAIKETRRGLFLSVGDGVTMYVPKSALQPAGGVAPILRWSLQATGAESGP